MSAFGLVFPVWMICGVFWPLDAVPNYYLRQLFYLAPLSYPIESMRYVISRGWTIFFPDVQLGFAVSGLYNIVLFSSTAILFHFTSK
jgi:ABC-type multidrug transport system permease subunit